MTETRVLKKVLADWYDTYSEKEIEKFTKAMQEWSKELRKQWENQRIKIKELQEENELLKDKEISIERLEHFLEWVDDKTDFFENRDTSVGIVVNEYLHNT